MIALAAALALAAPTTAPAPDTGQVHTYFGSGLKSCGRWTEDKQKSGPDRIGDAEWLAGFASGVNSGMMKDATGSADIFGMVGWMDNYCAEKPLEKVSFAATVLIMTLLMRH